MLDRFSPPAFDCSLEELAEVISRPMTGAEKTPFEWV